MDCGNVLDKAWGWEGCEKIDVLQGTNLEKYAEEWRFGLWLIRRKIPRGRVGAWAVQCSAMFSGLGIAKNYLPKL